LDSELSDTPCFLNLSLSSISFFLLCCESIMALYRRWEGEKPLYSSFYFHKHWNPPSDSKPKSHSDISVCVCFLSVEGKVGLGRLLCVHTCVKSIWHPVSMAAMVTVL
jgi:hypothetical protein